MSDESKTPKPEERVKKVIYNNGPSGAVYGFGFIGALIYFFQHVATIGAGVLAFLKAIVWPAIVAYKLLEFFKM
jgi:hypothetical protein